MTFCANLFTNIIIIFAATTIDIKIMKVNKNTEANEKYLAQLEVIEKIDFGEAKWAEEEVKKQESYK